MPASMKALHAAAAAAAAAAVAAQPPPPPPPVAAAASSDAASTACDDLESIARASVSTSILQPTDECAAEFSTRAEPPVTATTTHAARTAAPSACPSSPSSTVTTAQLRAELRAAGASVPEGITCAALHGMVEHLRLHGAPPPSDTKPFSSAISSPSVLRFMSAIMKRGMCSGSRTRHGKP